MDPQQPLAPLQFRLWWLFALMTIVALLFALNDRTACVVVFLGLYGVIGIIAAVKSKVTRNLIVGAAFVFAIVYLYMTWGLLCEARH